MGENLAKFAKKTDILVPNKTAEAKFFVGDVYLGFQTKSCGISIFKMLLAIFHSPQKLLPNEKQNYCFTTIEFIHLESGDDNTLQFKFYNIISVSKGYYNGNLIPL